MITVLLMFVDHHFLHDVNFDYAKGKVYRTTMKD